MIRQSIAAALFLTLACSSVALGLDQIDAKPTGPGVTITKAPAEGSVHTKRSSSTTIRFTGDPGAVRFECVTKETDALGVRTDAGPFVCGSGHRLQLGSQVEHTLKITAFDEADDPGPPAVRNFTVDRLGPEISLDGGKLAVDKKGKAKTEVGCDPIEISGPCQGKLVLKTDEKLPKRLFPGKFKGKNLTGEKRIQLSNRSFTVEPGEKRSVRLKMGRRAWNVVRRRKAFEASLISRSVDAVGNSRKATAEVTLKKK